MSNAPASRVIATANSDWRYMLLATVLPSAVVPVALAVLFELYLDAWRLTSEPFHALVEGIGSVAAVLLATFILIMRSSGQLRPGYLWVATTLIGMGLLDGFHAGVHPGPVFVWLHSLATLVGGLTFALVVLSDRISSRPALRTMPYLMAAACMMVGITSVLFPDIIPAMLNDSGFTLTAELLNFVGGAGFVVAWMHFTYSGRYENDGERLVLANHCLLFGTAGLLFHFSTLWDATWWLWHVLRLFAYLVILWFFLRIFYQEIKIIRMQRDELRLSQMIIEQSGEAIVVTDSQNRIVAINNSYLNITGYSRDEVIGANPSKMRSGRHDSAFYKEMWDELLNHGQWTGELWDRRKNGEIFPKRLTINAIADEQGATTHYVGIFSDITERKKTEEEIYSLAYFDVLTKLPNRRLLQDRIHQALFKSARSRLYGALLFLDMDKFKILNDTLGHDYGDLLLIEIAKRLGHCVREADTVARIGGDEFVVLMEEVGQNEEDALRRVALVAEKIRSVLATPYQLKEHEHHSSPSIGVTLYCCDNEDSVESLLKHADMAMYKAKEFGRNAVQFYDPAMQSAVETRASLEHDLRLAVSNRQLALHYQVQMNSDLEPTGAEALIRWVHPVRGMVSPGQFIPIAEDSTLILEIGNWVLEAACKQIARWSSQEHTRHLILAVNVSAQQFKRHDFVNNISSMVHINQINPGLLKIELTESVILNDIEDVIAKMHALKALGVRLSLDDFGTGYSSLSYLKRLPLDQIKIDQSFVRDIATDVGDAVMVQTIINLSESFQLNVIAEGVETEEQLNFLKKNGCKAYQGYLFSKPVPIAEFENLVERTVRKV